MYDIQHDRLVDKQPVPTRYTSRDKILPGDVPSGVEVGVELEPAPLPAGLETGPLAGPLGF